MVTFKLCFKIFFFRIVDVSLGTFVTVLTVKNKRLIATILGFIDVLIWFFVVKEALNTNSSSIFIALSYAFGYALGTFIGTTLSNTLINGMISVQVVLDNKYISEINKIRAEGYAVSQIDCLGKDNSKKIMLFIEVGKKNLNNLKAIIKKIDNKAFIIVNDTRYVVNGFFK